MATDALTEPGQHAVVGEDDCCGVPRPTTRRRLPAGVRISSPLVSSLAALAIAFFPKCPMCWAAYLSLFGVAGVEWLSSSAWLLPVLVVVMLINLASAWWMARRSQRRAGFYLTALGALAILVLSQWLEAPYASALGILLTATGSLLSVRPLTA